MPPHRATVANERSFHEGSHETTGHPKTGRRALAELYDATPQTPETRRLRGFLALAVGKMWVPKNGHYESARFLKRARVLLGERADIHFHLGEYFRKHKMTAVAKKFFVQANTIDPAFDIPPEYR